MTGSGSTVRPPLVVGVEHNDAGRLAVEWAADQAERRGLPLHLVRALDWPAGAPRPQFTVAREPAPRHRESARAHATSWPTQVYRDADMIPPTHGWGDKFREAGTAALEDARTTALERHPKLEVTDALLDGDPVTVLASFSDDAAMIVLGSRDLSAMSELVTSRGVAVPLLARAKCPVAVVRGAEQQAEPEPFLVVGTDGSERSQASLAYAFDEASRRGAVLKAILVTQAAVPYLTRHALDEARGRLTTALADWKARYPQVEVQQEAVHGHAVQTLTEESRHALEVVVGTRAVGGLRGMILGSVSHGVLHHATCPVVLVPTGKPAED